MFYFAYDLVANSDRPKTDSEKTLTKILGVCLIVLLILVVVLEFKRGSDDVESLRKAIDELPSGLSRNNAGSTGPLTYTGYSPQPSTYPHPYPSAQSPYK